MQASTTLLGACGLYCGSCYHYRASFPEGEHLLTEKARKGRKLEGFTCKGCRSEKHYIHPNCAQCEIRACTDRKGILHCGECSDFPCDRIRSFQSDGRLHHEPVLEQLRAIKEKGVGPWLDEQKERWRCSCGTGFSWYEEYCNVCKEPLDSFGPDPIEPK